MITCVSIVVILNLRLRWWCVLCIYMFHPYLQTAVEVNERIEFNRERIESYIEFIICSHLCLPYLQIYHLRIIELSQLIVSVPVSVTKRKKACVEGPFVSFTK